MKALKKILFPLCSLFLVYFSIKMVSDLARSTPDLYNNQDILVISFLLTLCITGIFAFVGFAYPTNIVLPDAYYEINNPSLLEKIGKVLGVKNFQFLLLLFFWGNKKNRKKYFNGTKSGLHNFAFQTKQSEFGHLGAFVLILLLCIYLVVLGYYLMALIMAVINIIGNVYPIILQRMHRVRIEKITNRKS